MSQNQYKEIVAEVVDDKMTPNLRQDVSRVSSGLSSAASGHSSRGNVDIGSPEATVLDNLTCPHCGKKYKQRKGFQNHIFLHKIEDYNQRKPNLEVLAAVMHDLVIQVLQCISNEENSSDEKKEIINELLGSAESPDWVQFLETLSGPVIQALGNRTKLLPSNQYEEFLCSFNKFLNDKKLFSSLRDNFVVLLSENFANSMYVGLILSRLCSCLPEKVQSFLVSEMSKGVAVSNPTDSVFFEQAFMYQISSILRHYCIKIHSLTSEVWRVRYACIKTRFVNFHKESCDLLKKESWVIENVVPSECFLKFCKQVETVIRESSERLEGESELDLDFLVTQLLDPPYLEVANMWYSLTCGYLSELDSLVFMRDFVAILLKNSLKLEENLIRAQQEEKQRLVKVATRENLKRN